MHLRNRHLIDKIVKRRKAFPLVGVLGARQVGKSTLLRDILAKQLGVTYITLDRPQILRDAKSRPEGFVLTHTEEFKKPIIIDEAHKAPPLFDVLKVLADERKNRGIVLLTGSVDFLSVSGIRETLTGRIGMTRLYPLTVGEIAQRRFCRSHRYYPRGRYMANSGWHACSLRPRRIRITGGDDRGMGTIDLLSGSSSTQRPSI
jgi:predicted AAA+ superfamily ATPase